jgi:hypothetical protein
MKKILLLVLLVSISFCAAPKYLSQIIKAEYNYERTEKWYVDVNYYFVPGMPEYYKKYTRGVANEINNMIKTINVRETDNISAANFFICFDNAPPQAMSDVPSSYSGAASTYADRGRIETACIWINSDRSDIKIKHTIREEFTQAFGLLGDSWWYPNSIFYQGYSEVTEFAPIDIECIKYYYNEMN